MTKKRLSVLAVLCQLLSLFPFAAVCEGVGLGEYVWWHYAAYYACLAAFWLCGRLCGAWITKSAFSRKTKPFAIFVSHAAVIIPAGIFAAIVGITEFSSILLLYVLPAAIIAFFGGRSSAALEYYDIFSRGWFALYFAAAIIGAILLWFVPNKEVGNAGVFQLCLMLGVITVLAAVLANQTNIDIQTNQRSAGAAALPHGLRGYNAALVAAVCAITAGLFLFAKPLAALTAKGIKALLSFLLSLVRERQLETIDYDSSETYEGTLSVDAADNFMFALLSYVFVGALAFLAIRFRRQIWAFLKELFSPLFKGNDTFEPLPFADEVSALESERARSRARRKREQALLKKYRRENDPAEKFRLGYAVFLCRLSRTPYAQTLYDTTTIHGQKGAAAFVLEQAKQLAAIYDEVRYGERAPSVEELNFEEELLRKINKGSSLNDF